MISGRKAVRVASKILIWLLGIFTVLFILLWSVLKVPAVQNFLIKKATGYVSNKTHTRVELAYIDLEFPKSILLQGIFLEDTKHDTLVSIGEIEVNLNMLALLSNTVSIETLGIDNFYVRLKRTNPDTTFNFQFLADAFTSDDTKEVVVDTVKGTPWTIKANSIALTNGRFDMLDETSGMLINVSAGEIEAELNKLDITASYVDLGDIKLSEVHGNMRNTKPAAPDTDTSSGGWNGIHASLLTIEHSSFKYSDDITAMLIDVNIGELELKPSTIDLTKQLIASDGLSIGQSRALIQLKKSSDTSAQHSDDPESAEWNVQVSSLNLKQNDFKMDFLNEPEIPAGIDWNHLALTGINTSAKDISYNGPLVKATIESLSAQENSGFGVRSLKTVAYMDATSASLTDLSLVTNHSYLGQDIKVTFNSLSEIMSSLSVDCSMMNNQVAVRDLLLLVPSLDTVEIIHKNKDRRAAFNLIAKGNLNRLDIQQFYFKTLNTSIDTKGRLNFITDPDKLFIDLNIKRIQTGGADLTALLPDSTLPASIQIPSEVFATGNYIGTLSDFHSTIDMSSSIGSAFIDADIKNLQKEIPVYTLALQTHSFDLGQLMNQSSLGKLNGAVDVTGSGFDTSSIKATIHSDIESFGLNDYVYHNIQLDGSIDKKLIEATGTVDDQNLNLLLTAKANLDKQQEFYDAQINLKGADFKGLGITTENINLSANTDIHLTGDPTQNINGHVSTRNILVIQNGKRYKEDSLILVSINEPGKSNMKLNSSMVAASFDGNIDVFSVSDAITNHLNRYFLLTETKFKQTKPQNFVFEIKLNDSPLLREVLLPSLQNYKPLSISGSFNSEEAKMAVSASIPLATYSGITVNEFVFDIDSDADKLTYNTGWNYLKTGGITLQQTTADGLLRNDTASINVTIKDVEQRNKIKLNSIVTHASKDHYRFSIVKDGLMLQEDKWAVTENNYIEIASNYIFADHFNLSHEKQFIKLQSAAEGNDMNLQFSAFDLHTLSQIVEDTDTLLVQGILNGEVNLKNIHQNPAFTSKLDIQNLAYKDSRVGNLKITADNLTADRYTANIELTDSLNRATIGGYYLSSDENSALHFNADIKSIQLHSLEAFSGGQISGSTGLVRGNIAITGPVKEPRFNGDIQFIEASTKVAYINQRIFMKKETITVSSEKVTFKSFNILDSLNNEAIINGTVGIEKFDNATFNLTVTTNDFMILNTTAVNNKLYYGRVFLDSKISIKGDQNLPVINATIDIEKGSHFTFAIPDSKISVDRGDGIVIFTTDSSSLDPIMLRQNEEVIAEKITGLDLSAKIHIDRNSTLKILVDPISGDSLSVRGDADLNFKMDASGQTNLTGTYVVNDGNYKASLENLIVRKFNISRGSKIIWTGDPLDALIDIKATYTTKTAPDGLLINSAVIDSSAMRKPLPFIVVMSMQGELLKPTISFQLDMPDNAKGALGGEVYSKITNINANESEVNKQVFALLVLNRFITPEAGGGGSGASDFARRSVSRMMSNELNKLSAKYVEGLQIDVDVQSYNQVNNGQQRGNTQVEVGVTKTLFDERLSVQIGGNVPIEGQDASSNSSTAKNITGDVTVEYKLTKNGRYKVKAFRKNEYDGISNGTIVETGAGIMYIRNFTHFKELFISKKKRKELTQQKTPISTH